MVDFMENPIYKWMIRMTNPHFLSFSATGMSVWLFEFQWLLAGVLCPPRHSYTSRAGRNAAETHRCTGCFEDGPRIVHQSSSTLMIIIVMMIMVIVVVIIIITTSPPDCLFFGTLGKGSTDLQRLSSNIMFSKLQAKPTSQTQWMFKYNLA